jgi:VanZ family protein
VEFYGAGMKIIGLVLLFGVPFFFFGGPGAHGSRSFVALWDLGHVLFFFLTSIWLYKYQRSRFRFLSFLAIFRNVFLVVFVLGVLVEGVQMCSVARAPDVYDILRNQLGCLLVFAIYYQQKGFKRIVFRFVIIGFMCFAFIPLLRGVTDEWIARKQFPVISDFETSLEIDRWKSNGLIRIEKGIARHGEHALRVQLTTDTYSGVSLEYFHGNWQGFTSLFFSVYNPDDVPLEAVCRIQDSAYVNRYDDRFNRSFLLKTGWNDIVISLEDVEHGPEGRLLNLAEVESFKLFVMEQERERIIFMDWVYLE